MRIAVVVGRFPVLSETFVLNQIVGLIERGHDVDILACAADATGASHPDVQRFELLKRTRYLFSGGSIPQRLSRAWQLISSIPRCPLMLPRALNVLKYGTEAARLKLLGAAATMVRLGDYDVFHCHFGPNGQRIAMLREVCSLSGRLLTTFHGYDVTMIPQERGPDVYRHLFSVGDFYTANTPYTAQRAISLGCPEERMVTIPMGVNLSRFRFKERRLSAGESVRVVTIARLVEKKGLEYAIRAVHKVTRPDRPILYRIIGDGPLRRHLENLIGALNIGHAVQLVGWKTQEDVAALCSDAHLFMLPSVTAADGDTEGQALVLQEAQAMGLPILSTLHNGIPDGVLDGQSGFLVPERDEEALADRLSYLVEHPNLWSAMGHAGRTFVEDRYDIEKLNDRLVTIFHAVRDGTIVATQESSQ